MARQLGLGASGGVVISSVDEGSAADAAGLQQGDVIVELNRQHVSNLHGYQRLLDAAKPSDVVLLLINRSSTLVYVPIAAE
jgi:serine protease Do